MAQSTYQQTTWHAARPNQAISPHHKVILLGVAGVGKTAFFLRVRDGVFRQPKATCIPADYLVKTVRLPDSSSSSAAAALKVSLLQYIQTLYLFVYT